MFHLVDFLLKGCGSIIISDFNCLLKHYRSVIHLLVDKMHGYPRHLHPVVKGIRDCVHANKGGKQSRVNIQDSIFVGSDEAQADHRA